ncbi:MAG: thymidine kinase [Flavobacteriales bacterium]|jgi:thymidine kinase|nr:thymidine kinase [Flavobacteriales bacterium]MDC0908543.1 thymidine kinase [Flavobacteriales bacterium]MDC3390306.1 thymidine kinase [Flavobacteriales bacterium]
MFIDSQIKCQMLKGSIEIICGSMFSGKTEELLRRLKRAEFAKQKVAVFKPLIDTRYDARKIVSHDSNAIKSKPVKLAIEILDQIDNAEVIAIDEAQFFDKELIRISNLLANQGKRVIIAGLDMDFKGKPFGIMPDLLAIAEHITKVHAICIECGTAANHSYRLTKNQQLIELGDKLEYKALCRDCFFEKEDNGSE